jgi:hypothetical protein
LLVGIGLNEVFVNDSEMIVGDEQEVAFKGGNEAKWLVFGRVSA